MAIIIRCEWWKRWKQRISWDASRIDFVPVRVTVNPERGGMITEKVGKQYRKGGCVDGVPKFDMVLYSVLYNASSPNIFNIAYLPPMIPENGDKNIYRVANAQVRVRHNKSYPSSFRSVSRKSCTASGCIARCITG